jgi:hypothetical protein
MNDQIAKLYDQALVLESNGDYVAGELDPVKFAELIVQECIDNLLWHGHDEAASQLEWLRGNRFGIKK